MVLLLMVVLLDINTRLSAKNRWDKGGLCLDILIGAHLPLSNCWFLLWERTSIQRINMYGEIESPCLIPLDGAKYSVLVPFTSIVVELVQIQDMMRLTIFFRKLKYWRVCFTKYHSILSNTFSKSIFIIKLPFSLFILLKCRIISCTMMALSAAYLFLRKLVWHGPIILFIIS